MIADALKLSVYFGEAFVPADDALMRCFERHGVRCAALMRGIEGFGINRRIHAERFPDSTRWRSHELQLALGQFSHRLQHAHVQALLASARTVTLTSDVSEQYTRLGAASQPLPLIGSAHLSELFPAAVSADLHCAEWLWPRVVSTPDQPRGRLLRVNGCLYSAAPSSARA